MLDLKFTRYFPAHHVRKGEETHFIEKVWKAIDYTPLNFPEIIEHFYWESVYHNETPILKPKRTTIRAGHRFKEGDWFQPKAWTGLPYRSKPVAICQPLQIRRIQPIVIRKSHKPFDEIKFHVGKSGRLMELHRLATEDGFDEVSDFVDWFDTLKPGEQFDGQRIWFA